MSIILPVNISSNTCSHGTLIIRLSVVTKYDIFHMLRFSSMIQETWSLKEENFFGVCISVLLKIKEGETRRSGPHMTLNIIPYKTLL